MSEETSIKEISKDGDKTKIICLTRDGVQVTINITPENEKPVVLEMHVANMYIHDFNIDRVTRALNEKFTELAEDAINIGIKADMISKQFKEL